MVGLERIEAGSNDQNDHRDRNSQNQNGSADHASSIGPKPPIRGPRRLLMRRAYREAWGRRADTVGMSVGGRSGRCEAVLLECLPLAGGALGVGVLVVWNLFPGCGGEACPRTAC
jgi:hypothetical protein